MSELNLDEIKAHHERTVAAEGDQLTVSEHERGLLLAEVEKLNGALAIAQGMLGASRRQVDEATDSVVSLSGQCDRLTERCAQMERDHAETVTELAEVTRQRDAHKSARELIERHYQEVADQLYASCVCNTGPDTDGPEEDCPVDGREEFRPLSLRAAWMRVQELHSEFRIYDECGHESEDHNGDPFEVDDVGWTCRDGYLYSICRECCTDGSSQTEECASGHRHDGSSICNTRAALDGGAP